MTSTCNPNIQPLRRDTRKETERASQPSIICQLCEVHFVTKYVDLVSKNFLQKRQTPHNILNGKTRNKFVVLISSTEYLDVL